MDFISIASEVPVTLIDPVSCHVGGTKVDVSEAKLIAPSAAQSELLSKASGSLGKIFKTLTEGKEGGSAGGKEENGSGEMTAKEVHQMLTFAGGDHLHILDKQVKDLLVGGGCVLAGDETLTLTRLNTMTIATYFHVRAEYIRAFLLSSLVG